MKRNHIIIYTPTSKDGDPNMDGTTYNNNNNNMPHQEAMLIIQTLPRLLNLMHQSFVTTEAGAGWEVAGLRCGAITFLLSPQCGGSAGVQ